VNRNNKKIGRYSIPSIEKHTEISKQRTNNAYREVHEWIDDP
jgi:hypothetical protein